MSIRRGTTLSDSRSRRTSLLCLLYFCQGIPWGFATIALLATLSQAGHGTTMLNRDPGLATALVDWFRRTL